MSVGQKISLMSAVAVVGATVVVAPAAPVAPVEQAVPVYPAQAIQLAAVTDQIDDAFIDLTVVIRTGATPALNSLGYIGKQLYIGLNLIESVAASAVFNGTDVLRGEGVLRNVGDFAFDVALSGLFVVIDELALSGNSEAIAIDRPPLDRPIRWEDADSPGKTVPLTVPDRDPIETPTQSSEPTEPAEAPEKTIERERPIRDAVAQLKAKSAEKKAERAERREQRREAREARRAARTAEASEAA